MINTKNYHDWGETPEAPPEAILRRYPALTAKANVVRFTEAEIGAVVAEYENGATMGLLAKKYRSDVHSVRAILRARGIKLRAVNNGRRGKKHRIWDCLDEVRDIAQKHPFSKIPSVMRRFGVRVSTAHRALEVACDE